MGHQWNDERSLAYHRAIASHLLADDGIVIAARAVVERWRGRKTVAAYYVERWSALLSRSSNELAAALVDPGEQASELRQVSPFTGALEPRERWAIWRRTRREDRRDDTRTA